MITPTAPRPRIRWLLLSCWLLSLTIWLPPATAAPPAPAPVQPARLTNVRSGLDNGNLVIAHERVYFGADDGSGGALWATDGTLTGTLKLKKVPHGIPWDLTVLNGAVYFFARMSPSSAETALWRSDGTADGTVPVRTVAPASTLSAPSARGGVASGLLFFYGSDSPDTQALWRSDGTAAGTFPLAPAPGQEPATIRGGGTLGAVGDEIYVGLSTLERGRELWHTRGISNDLTLVKSIAPGIETANVSQMTVMSDTLYFVAQQPGTGNELWRSDGTEAGTYIVKDFVPGWEDGRPEGLMAWQGALYMSANHPTASRGLWRSDGTAAGTHPVMDPSAPAGLVTAGFVPWNGTLVFIQYTLTGTDRLWQTTGTTASTRLIAGTPARLGALHVIDHSLLLTADDGQLGQELWAVRPGGTVLVADILPGSAGSLPYPLLAVGEHIIFTAAEATGVRQVWSLPREARAPLYRSHLPIVRR